MSGTLAMSKSLNAEQAAGLIQVVEGSNFPGSNSEQVTALKLSLLRIVNGTDVVAEAKEDAE